MSGSGSSTPTSRPSTPTTPPVEQPQALRPVQVSVIRRIGQAAPLQTQATPIPATSTASTGLLMAVPSTSSAAVAPTPQPAPVLPTQSMHPRFSLQSLFAPPQMVPHWHNPSAATGQPAPRAPVPRVQTAPAIAPQPQPAPAFIVPTAPSVIDPKNLPPGTPIFPWYNLLPSFSPLTVPLPNTSQRFVPIAPRPPATQPSTSQVASISAPSPQLDPNSIEAILRNALNTPLPSVSRKTYSSLDPTEQGVIRARAVLLMAENLRLGFGSTQNRVCKIIMREFNVDMYHSTLNSWARHAKLSFEQEKKEEALAERKAKAQAMLLQGKSHAQIAQEVGIHKKNVHKWISKSWIKRPSEQEQEKMQLVPIPHYTTLTEYSSIKEAEIIEAIRAHANALFQQGMRVRDVRWDLKFNYNINCKSSCVQWWKKELEAGQTRKGKPLKRPSSSPTTAPSPKFKLVVVPEPQDDSSSTRSEAGTSGSGSRLVFSPPKSPQSSSKEDSDSDSD